jgi:hypothetical protein
MGLRSTSSLSSAQTAIKFSGVHKCPRTEQEAMGSGIPHFTPLYFICSVDMTITDTWGYAINGSWTGLTGFLQREEADIGSTGMFVLKQRLSVVNFIAVTTSTRCCAGVFAILILCTLHIRVLGSEQRQKQICVFFAVDTITMDCEM